MHRLQIPNVAIVGAGITAAVLANLLSQHGIAVDLYEKSRGAGGRLSTRRSDTALFNHGCPADAAIEAGLSVDKARYPSVTDGRLHDGAADTQRSPFLAASGLVKTMLAERTVRYGTAVERLEKHQDGWQLLGNHGQILGTAPAVVITPPATQALKLLPDALVEWKQALAAVRYSSCWVAMLCTREVPNPDIAIIDRLTRGHIDTNAEIAGHSAWVAHATPDFSQTHLELSADDVLPLLINACGLQLSQIQHAQAHRWRYAQCLNPIPSNTLWDSTRNIGIAGDACGSDPNALRRAIHSARACTQRLLNIDAGDCGA